MKRYRVVLKPRAKDDLYNLHLWIEERAGPDVADAYLGRIEAVIAKLDHYPARGTLRDSVAAGCRSIAFERRKVIFYRIVGDEVRIERVLDGASEFDGKF